MSDKLPTAEEFFKEKYGIADRISTDVAALLAIEFAKLQVKAALESAAEKVTTYDKWENNDWESENPEGFYTTYVNKDSILNAYPENLIV